MNINYKKLVRRLKWALFIVSLGMGVGHLFLPDKVLILHPNPNAELEIYGFIDQSGTSAAYWLDESRGAWQCDFKPEQEFGCGFTINWDPDFISGLDARSFETLTLKLDYQGPATKLRAFMRNQNVRYSETGNANSSKFMSTIFALGEMQGNQLELNLANFGVADWWLNEHHERRRWSTRERDNIVQIGIDLIEPGQHLLLIHSMTLRGPRFNTLRLFHSLLVVWMLVFLVEGVRQIWGSYWLSIGWRKRLKKLQQLRPREQPLSVEKASLLSLEDKDPLTGVLNREGALRKLQELMSGNCYSENFSIMLLDLDNFKHINEQFGHDSGDAVLRSFGALLQMNTDQNDILARWGGEQFILVCNTGSPHKSTRRAEKLRTLTSAMTFSSLGDISLTLSVGIASQEASETFENTLMRAEQALATAKERGRNQVVYHAV